MIDEIETTVIQRYLKEEKPDAGELELDEAFEIERLGEMEYFGRLFNESNRIDPSAGETLQPRFMTRDERLGSVTLKQGDKVFVHIWGLHHNPDEWQRPSEFLPERFDPASPLYLTPKGTKRHPYSFMPFGGGDRVCFGKSFADYSIRTISSILLYSLNFEFVDKKWMT